MKRALKSIGRGLLGFVASMIRAIMVVAALGGLVAYANYTMTQGAGTTFGSVVVGGVHYVQMFICDLTTPAQCASVSASGAVKVDNSAVTQPVSAASLPLPTGAATAANQATEIASLATIATNTGAPIPPQAVGVPIGGFGLCDGANGATNPCTTVATVKAGSTAPVATDKPLVVSLSPGASAGLGASGTPVRIDPTGTTTQPVNSAQVNGVTTSTGTGAVGTGTQRVAIGTDTATVAGTAPVKGGIGVVNGGSNYQAVAASQTATVLQTSTGATGDYLSHCDLYPTSTSPGVVTVFDNANAAATNVIAFPGGASSLSNLAPISIPVGAVSTAGAWKVTTGASISVVCYGKFS